MAKRLRILNAILCDYVGAGHANKHTIVNAISGNVLVQAFPTEVGFGIYVEFAFDTENRPDVIEIEVRLNKKVLFRGHGSFVPGIQGEESATFIIPHFEFGLMATAVLELYVSADGYARTLGLRKTISEGVIPASA